MTNSLVNTFLGSTEPLSVDDLARLCGTEPKWILQIVELGILHPDGGEKPHAWHFSSQTTKRAIEARRLECLLDANLDTVAMLMDLSEEIHRLKSLMRIHGIHC